MISFSSISYRVKGEIAHEGFKSYTRVKETNS